MSNYEQTRISNIDGLKSSIITDKYVYRWFLFLILQKSFKSRSDNYPEIEKLYKNLKSIITRQWILGILLLVLIIVLINTKNLFFFIPLILVGVLIFKNLSSKKHLISEISIFFIERDFEADVLARTTLYQIGEIYSEKYKILSLVDSIYHLDKIYRFTLLFSFLLIAYITDFGNWIVKHVLFISIYFIVFYIANSSFIYKRFK